VDIASEFRYRDPIVDDNTVVLAISQSGETADTLAAMEEGRQQRRRAVVDRQCDWLAGHAPGRWLYLDAGTGPEIGVASTKAFTAPLVDLYMLAVLLADLRGTICAKQRKELVKDLALRARPGGALPGPRRRSHRRWRKALKDTRHALYLGRGINMPIAYEGALKLKEISYIHAEAYPAGEMKHGPIALVDRDMPVIAIAAQ
jgi:glutamine---fructose-6-phosphate transaminase (isomerizing)